MTTTPLGPSAGFDRRSLLKRGAALGAGTVLFSGGTQALAQVAHAAARNGATRVKAPGNGGYGPLQPAVDRTTGEVLLHLPEGFTYASFGHGVDFAGWTYTGSDGVPTPGRHDGMAAFATSTPGVVRLVRNHEQGYGVLGSSDRAYDNTLFGDRSKAYDPTSNGACTTLVFDTERLRLLDSFVSLTGTSVNCAGGLTPWGTWLSCEETVNGRQNGFARDHGYVFEVDPRADRLSAARPYPAMGRFAHEAVAVDPATGVVYETEDDGTTSGFYRFVPTRRGDLRRGALEMLAVKGRPNLQTHVTSALAVGESVAVEWVRIDDPDPADITRDAVFDQGWARGAASFARLEGAWWDSGSCFFNATSGGDAGCGQVWEYRPTRGGGTLTKLFESPSAEVLDAPDNLCVSPRGALVLCEDGGGEQFVRGLNVDGELFDVARNAMAGDNELAGACFSPDGSTLFVNVQTPGVSFAVQGPWGRGAL